MPRRPLRTFALLALLLAVAGGVGCALACVSIPADIGLADGHLRPCPRTPNCVNSEEAGGDWSIEPLAFTGDAELAFRSLLDFLAAEPRVDLVTVEPGYAHAVFRTALLRFRDDVELRLDPEAGVIHVRSASRLGRSDLGANRARVESIRARWRPAATGAGPDASR